MTTNPGESGEALEALCRRVFLAAHQDGWTGNQRRRDVQHVDAEKSWSLYVGNGALEKVLTATRTGEVERLREALVSIRDHAHVRIQDGKELGATVWRLALEDVEREATQALATGETSPERGER